MKTLIILLLTVVSFPILAQYNPEKINTFKIGSSYGGGSGLEFNFGYERNITSKQSLYGSVFKSQISYGYSLGYKYNLLSYKWIEAFAGIDIRSEYTNYKSFGIEARSFDFTIEPTLELRFNVNKTHYITTGMHFNPIFDREYDYDSYWLNRLNIGVAKRF